MAFPPKQLLPCLCAIVLPSIMFFSHANAQRCKIPDSDQDRLRINYNMEDVSSGLYAIDDETVLSTIAVSQAIRLWQICPDGLEVDEASFSVAIFYQQLSNQSGLAFLLLPLWGDDASLLIKQLADKDVGTLKFSDSTYRSDPVSGSSVSVRTGVLASIWNHGSSIMIVDNTIHPPAAAGPSKYGVWIDYARVGGILSVYVEAEGKTKPDNAVAEVHLYIYTVASSYVRFGLLCAAEQFSNSNVDRLHWNATIDDLSYSYNYINNTHNKDIRKVTVLCSVLGSIVATAVMAMAMALYLNSRHRQWRKDLDQLARSMECLPGVPTKIDFSDIKKATGNFHEAMKLGGGGYGTVYRCTLPFAASKTERPMDVAVKRFTRDVQERRYDDFLAEVSIINRLRHKNIVPLVGKGGNIIQHILYRSWVDRKENITLALSLPSHWHINGLDKDYLDVVSGKGEQTS